MAYKSFNNIERLEKIIDKLIVDQSITYGLKASSKKTLKEIKLYKNHLNGLKELNKINNLNKTKIQIGGGKHILKEYLNIDIVPPADIIYDIREGLPCSDECSEFIFSEHFLEHINYPIAVKRFISECYRVLKFGGKLVIGVPDGELMIKKYIKKDRKFFRKIINKWYSKRDCLRHINTYIDLLNLSFRDQDDSEKYNPHLWTYDYEKLISLLKECGFHKVSKWRFDRKIANPERKYGSIYVVAMKVKS